MREFLRQKYCYSLVNRLNRVPLYFYVSSFPEVKIACPRTFFACPRAFEPWYFYVSVIWYIIQNCICLNLFLKFSEIYNRLAQWREFNPLTSNKTHIVLSGNRIFKMRFMAIKIKMFLPWTILPILLIRVSPLLVIVQNLLQ